MFLVSHRWSFLTSRNLERNDPGAEPCGTSRQTSVFTGGLFIEEMKGEQRDPFSVAGCDGVLCGRLRGAAGRRVMQHHPQLADFTPPLLARLALTPLSGLGAHQSMMGCVIYFFKKEFLFIPGWNRTSCPSWTWSHVIVP